MSALRQAAQAVLDAYMSAKTYPWAIAAKFNGPMWALRDALAAEPAQEPAAWIDPAFKHGSPYRPTSPVTVYEMRDWTPLYTAPPQRQPLTDEQIAAAVAAERERCKAAIRAAGPKDGPMRLITDGFIAALGPNDRGNRPVEAEGRNGSELSE